MNLSGVSAYGLPKRSYGKMGGNLPILSLKQTPGSELGYQSEKCDENGVIGEGSATETAGHLTAVSGDTPGCGQYPCITQLVNNKFIICIL